jgi:hypothetical protein
MWTGTARSASCSAARSTASRLTMTCLYRPLAIYAPWARVTDQTRTHLEVWHAALSILAGMGVREEIFPSERREAFVQTEWSKGWGYAGIGYREAARLLTEQKLTFGPSIDQTGLAIFFLQRHRVELALKELLVERGVDIGGIKSQHSLVALWYACKELIGARTFEWQQMDSGGELITVLDDADPGSYSFRYPVDKYGKENERPQFIDLDALAEHVDSFVSLIDGYLAYVEEAEQAQREYEDEMR